MVIGICGGTGSGKTTVARHILNALGDHIVYLQQDHYYKNLSHLPAEQRCQRNFDHPDALDLDLMAAHLRQLRAGQPIERPVYDFAQHVRRPDTLRMEPRPVVLVEGILIFAVEALRHLMDLKIFVDTDADLRLLRRLQRDIEERGRTVESVLRQYLETVRPMHLQFVEPSKRYADLILPGSSSVSAAVDLVLERIKSVLRPQAESSAS